MKMMALGACLMLLGLFLGLTFATRLDVLADAKWWELLAAWSAVAAAIATTAAVVVALSLATRSEKRQDETDAEIGLTALRVISSEFATVEASVSHSIHLLSLAIALPDGEALQEPWRYMVVVAAEGIRLDQTARLVEKLHLLPGDNRGDWAAKALGTVSGFQHALTHTGQHLATVTDQSRKALALLIDMGEELQSSLASMVVDQKVSSSQKSSVTATSG